MADKAKEFRYAIGLDRAGRVTADGHSPLELDPAWTPEHLLLAALVRCTLQSLRFHADHEGVDFVASASASGMVTKRPEAEPAGEELAALVEKAERDCFVGASLNPSPRYRWRVNRSNL